MTDEAGACGAPSTRQAARAYSFGMAGAGVTYGLVLSGSIIAIERFHPPQWVAVVLALATMGPIIFMLRTYLVFLSRVDEMQKRIQHEAMLLSAGIVGFGAMTYGFLEAFAGFPTIPGVLLWVLPAMIAIWGVATYFVSRRYK